MIFLPKSIPFSTPIINLFLPILRYREVSCLSFPSMTYVLILFYVLCFCSRVVLLLSWVCVICDEFEICVTCCMMFLALFLLSIISLTRAFECQDHCFCIGRMIRHHHFMFLNSFVAYWYFSFTEDLPITFMLNFSYGYSGYRASFGNVSKQFYFFSLL